MTDVPTPPPKSDTPVLLTYDRHDPNKDRGGNRTILFFWLGILSASCAYAVVLSTTYYFLHSKYEPFFDGLVVPIIFGMIFLIPGTLFLGITMWARLKIIKEVSYVGARKAFITGAIFNLCLQPVPRMMPEELLILWIILAWVTIYPIAAGFWLCYRSHLRE